MNADAMQSRETDAQVAPQSPPKPPQLQMVWPTELLRCPPTFQPANGYRLRQYSPDDLAAYLDLMHLAGFEHFNPAFLDGMLRRILPRGFFVIEEQAAGLPVASAMATHNPCDLHPCGGELGWVAAHPAHAGRGLGLAVCAAVVRRYLEMGYERIYLKTDDWRLPAIKVYLKLGFRPFLLEFPQPAPPPDAPSAAGREPSSFALGPGAGSPSRWCKVCDALGWADCSGATTASGDECADFAPSEGAASSGDRCHCVGG
jgi:mycothiol synthase